MSIVKVAFKFDGSDDDDPTGLTDDEFTELHDEIMRLGGYDIEIVKEKE
jgi:hypothetical protein